MKGIIRFFLYAPIQDLADAAVAYSELSADDTRTDASCGHLDDLQPNVVGKRPAIDEHTSELVHPSLA